ncbi:hypothetical protein E2562_002696 [Oryza meyeriana var. granulata]|uniref:NADP-dependent oxidoreductase domain-containing protein n=1 Tax=Oryza meyeriana var. granulata TaxID=110450 RepID=A0A6G1BR85_9ORYZ|nr:hypothetical protein E2562_002696 [Oryza meyeriana var. granulata]
MEYVDLYLIHWPISIKPGPNVFPMKKEDAVQFDFEGVWRAMEECHRLGLAKAIGVSNFTTKHLDKLLAVATITPAVNQVSLRWIYEQEVTPIVKSYNKETPKQNLDIFDWELTEEDRLKISHIP